MVKKIKGINLKSVVLPVFLLTILVSVLIRIVHNFFVYLNMPQITIGSYVPSFFDRFKTLLGFLFADIFQSFILGIALSIILIIFVVAYNMLSKVFGRSCEK